MKKSELKKLSITELEDLLKVANTKLEKSRRTMLYSLIAFPLSVGLGLINPALFLILLSGVFLFSATTAVIAEIDAFKANKIERVLYGKNKELEKETLKELEETIESLPRQEKKENFNNNIIQTEKTNIKSNNNRR